MTKFKTKKRFGQHFLVDQKILSSICGYAHLQEGMQCIEIGPGQGALTKFLVKTSAKIHAIEIDKRLVPTLEGFVSKHENFSYSLSDVLVVDFEEIFQQDIVTVIGNLPYEISTPLLFKLVNVRHAIDQMVFLLQKEVVDRIIAPVGTKAYGRLSVMMQYYFDCEGLVVVPPEAFSPPPKVISQVVRLRPIQRDWVDHDQFSLFVKFLFAQQRKMLRQRFKPYMGTEAWDKLCIDASSRPGDLPLDAVIKLFVYLNQAGHF